MSRNYCPQCRGELKAVSYPADSYLNRDQWESQRAGDWYCESCAPNNRGAGNHYCYWWDSEVATHHIAATDRQVDLMNAAAMSFNFRDHLQRQRIWSEATFGPGKRTQGVIDHIRKELREIEAAPNDIEEWIDVVILALDGAWRAGAIPDDIINTLVRKQTKNESRQWPDWRTSDPNAAIQHIKECEK